jgi:transcription elongation factor Elf1
MIKIKFKIGKSMIEFENNDLKNIFKFSGLMGELPEACTLCNSPDVFLSHKSPKGNDYYMLKCKKCGAELNFHQRKEGGFYIKWDDKFEKYNPEKSKSPADITKEAVNGTVEDEPFDNNSVPF